MNNYTESVKNYTQQILREEFESAIKAGFRNIAAKCFPFCKSKQEKQLLITIEKDCQRKILSEFIQRKKI